MEELTLYNRVMTCIVWYKNNMLLCKEDENILNIVEYF